MKIELKKVGYPSKKLNQEVYTILLVKDVIIHVLCMNNKFTLLSKPDDEWEYPMKIYLKLEDLEDLYEDLSKKTFENEEYTEMIENE